MAKSRENSEREKQILRITTILFHEFFFSFFLFFFSFFFSWVFIKLWILRECSIIETNRWNKIEEIDPHIYTCVCVLSSFSHPVRHDAARQASLSFTISQKLPKFMFIASVMSSSHLIFWHRLLLHLIFPSARVFSNESSLRNRWPKYWSFSYSISPSSEHSGLISLKIDCFDLLAVQGNFRSLQHHSSKASIPWYSAFFTDHWEYHSPDYTNLKRLLLLGRKAMPNLDSILKTRDIILPAKVCLVKAMVFPVVMYGCESWTIKKAECQKIDAFEL